MPKQPDSPDPSAGNERWLAVLGGETAPSGSDPDDGEAARVREVLLRDSKVLDEQLREADEAEHQRLLFRLKRDGLWSRPEATRAKPSGQTTTRIWGIAASLVAAVVLAPLAVPGLGPSESGEEGLRGTTMVVVDTPLAKAAALATEAQGLGTTAEVFQRCDGIVEWTAPSSPSVLARLGDEDHRLNPVVTHGRIQILFAPPTVSTCSALGSYMDRVHRLRQKVTGAR